jgi:predicted acetyltransferase
MDIRPLEPSELGKLLDLYRNAYRIESQTAQRWGENIDLVNSRAIVDADRALSAIQIRPYVVEIGGKPLSMGGIGGVATWADQQGKGYAGALMSYSVGEMRRLGHDVSFLYPFSYRYYGKFGWEIGARRRLYQGFAQHQLPRYKEVSRVRAVVTDADFGLMIKCYEIGVGQYNGMALRSEKQWDNMRKRSIPTPPDRFLYYVIEGDRPAEPIGYFSCDETPLVGEYGFTTTVREFVCLNDTAYRAMFGFLATLPTNVKKLAVGAPESPCLLRYFTEPFIEIRLSAGFQARVVDVEQACSKRGWAPDAAGSVVFSLADEHGPWNAGTWKLDVADGCASICRTDTEPGIRLTIQQFSGIFVGFHDPVVWVQYGVLEPHCLGAARTLRQLFFDKPTNLLDWF